MVPIAANQLIILVCGIVGVKLISHIIPQREYGHYALFLSLAQMGGLLAQPGLINHAARYWHREAARIGPYARFLNRRSWLNVLCLAPFLFGAVVSLMFYEGNTDWLLVFPFLLLSTVSFGLVGLAEMVFNAWEKRYLVLVLGLVATSTRVFLPVGIAWLATPSFVALTAGLSLHSVIVCLFLAALFRWAWSADKPDTLTEIKWRKELREYGRPFIWLGLGGWLLQFSDRWIVAFFFGDTAAGIFAMAYNLGAILPALALAAALQITFPALFRQADAAANLSDWKRIARFCDYMTWLFLLSMLAGLALFQWFAPRLIGWLIAPAYAPAVLIILPAGLAAAAAQANQFYYLLLQGQHNSAAMVRVMILLAGLKTAGSIAAAAISWNALLWWLSCSVWIIALLGRWMIRQVALRPQAGKISESAPVLNPN